MTQTRSKKQVISRPEARVRVIEISYGTRCNFLINRERVPYYLFRFRRKTIGTKYSVRVSNNNYKMLFEE
jgi:hypothetical protein